jgi:CDP-glucose 4,6-dehydratase
MDNKIKYQSLKAFYHDKKILITGHTGFKGTWLIKILENFGAKIYGYSLPKNELNSFYTMHNFTIAGDYEGNINNSIDLSLLLNRVNPDILIHLAAQPLVSESYENPILTHETNILGTARILNLLNYFSNTKVALFITTDKVYKNDDSNISFKESDPLGGYDPYSASKAASEIIIESWRSTLNVKNIKILSARAGNVIGGGDWSKNRLLPDIFRALKSKEKVLIRNPHSTRPWQHVIEPLVGYLEYIKYSWDNPKHNVNNLNFGPDIEDVKSVKDLINELSIILKKKPEDIFTIEKNNLMYESKFLSLNNSLAKETLAWFPKFSSRESLQLTSEWYLNYQNIHSDEIIESQIEYYFNK